MNKVRELVLEYHHLWLGGFCFLMGVGLTLVFLKVLTDRKPIGWRS